MLLRPITILLLQIIPMIGHAAPKTIIAKLDNDNIPDSVFITDESCVDFAAHTIDIAFSTTGKRVSVQAHHSVHSFVLMIPVPNEVHFVKKYEAIVRNKIVGLRSVNRPDPTLNWYIAACKHKDTSTSNDGISYRTNFPLTWAKGSPAIDSACYYTYSYNSIACLVRQFNSCYFEEPQRLYKRYIVAIYPHNHGYIKQAPDGKAYGISHTKHGIFISRNNSYAWAFINDELVTDAAPRLRHTSIEHIEYHGTTLLVTTNVLGEHNFYVIDLATGVLYKVANEDRAKHHLSDQEMRLNGLSLIKQAQMRK